jgi:hypothetical protein
VISPIVDRLELFALRVVRAWRFYYRLGYSWRLAWAKAGSQCGCFK